MFSTTYIFNYLHLKYLPTLVDTSRDQVRQFHQIASGTGECALHDYIIMYVIRQAVVPSLPACLPQAHSTCLALVSLFKISKRIPAQQVWK